MLSISLRKSGGVRQTISVDEYATIQDVLDQAGITASEVTHEGETTSDFTRRVNEGDVVFVATAQKAGY